MRHADILAQGASTALDHSKRAFGRFYTPHVIASRLADAVAGTHAPTSDKSVHIVDPFCGDGRLVVAAIRSFSSQILSTMSWRVSLFDLDEEALQDAVEAVAATVDELDLDCAISAEAIDAFDLVPERAGAFDVVVTNPPWEALKPDGREMGGMSPSDRAAYLETMRRYDSGLAQKLPHSQPTRKFSGWGTNLSRCGLELALGLCRPGGGVCGIVLPASVMNDQSSASLRRWLFENHRVHRISHYPAEARLFDEVDQPFITVVASSDRPQVKTRVERYGPDGGLYESGEINVARDGASGGYRIPTDIPARLLRLLVQWEELPSLSEYEGKYRDALWMGRELDETGYVRFTRPEGQIPFVKGRMIGRYSQFQHSDLFLADPHASLPESARHTRIAWRDVSRRSQRRRMQATLIPADVVTGNSLHVAYFRDDDHMRLLALLAILNSIPVELQVRAGLGTGHVSLGVVRSLKVPVLDDPAVAETLASMAQDVLCGSAHFEVAIEAAVARLYGVGSDALVEIQGFFADPYASR